MNKRTAYHIFCNIKSFFNKALYTPAFLFLIQDSNAATITSTSSGGYWNVASTWTQTSRSGLILASVLSPTVTGVGTSFTTQLAVGSVIYNGTSVGTVASIQSNTSLTLTTNAQQTIVIGIGYTAQVVPFASDDVVIAPGATVTVTGNTNINTVSFSNTGSSAGNLAVNLNCTLTIAGSLTLQNRPTSNNSASLSGSGTIACASLSVGNSSPPTTASATYTHQLTSSVAQLIITGNLTVVSRIGSDASRRANGSFFLSSGTLTIGGSIVTTNASSVNNSTFSTASGAQSGTIILEGSSPVNLSGTGTNTFVMNGSATTVNFHSAGVQTIWPDNYTNILSSGTGARVLTSAGIISISGTFTPGTNTYTTTGSTVNFNGTGTQNIPAFTFENLIISNNITLNAYDTVTGVLSFGSTGKTLNANGYLILKSTAAKTAGIADITNAGSYSGNSINGAVVIERYIPSAKGWRLLSVPLSSSGAPTINEAWQEGVTTASGTPNPHPGYGIKIAGGTTVNGFDQSPTNSPFIKTYDNTTNSFIRLPASPGTNIPITNYPAYCIYIRGDRSVDLMQGMASSITATTLRMKGNIRMNNQPVTVAAGNYTLVSNPYPSAIDFGTLTRSNVKNTMYIWDPELAGTWGVGGYVTVSWNNATSDYDVTASVNPISQYIQSGTAFMVSSADNLNPGTLTIKETDKTIVTGSSRSGIADERMRINLYLVNPADSSASLLDGTLFTYADENLNRVDENDAGKIAGSNENIAIRREGTLLSIERRHSVYQHDTAFLNIAQLKTQRYKLEIVASNMDRAGRVAFIKDNYLSAINNTAIQLNGVTEIFFTVNADPASRAFDRFSIVFENVTALPVAFTSLQAVKQNEDIRVQWRVQNQVDVVQYEVESSGDGKIFRGIGILDAINNPNYTFLDKNVARGDHFYRIKSIGVQSTISYSSVVKINIAEETKHNAIHIYPNPVKGSVITFSLVQCKDGQYDLQVLTMDGKLVFQNKLNHKNNQPYKIKLSSELAPGKYIFRISDTTHEWISTMIKE